ncbi:FMRFamide-activated amiloride-sensitive sodium channel-like [Homarus americanus]|uniref:FMRFamide-activated amiloride-sensitive sodium channel-like n=1 Tax=Homarus americanus TaxID=6706 RepID=A0A8J5NCL6_HOMAM|nr:FMRFamide-activated amiloride-sensitive sodium channel-like [Homarus americanus]
MFLVFPDIDALCVKRSLVNYAKSPHTSDCGCNVACHEIQYLKSMSIAAWPPGPAKGISDVVTSLGGALSLYLGISLFLLVEVLELLIWLIYNSIMYAQGRYVPSNSRRNSNSRRISVFPEEPPVSTLDNLRYLKSVHGRDGLVEILSSLAPVYDSSFTSSEKHTNQLSDRRLMSTAFDNAFEF